MKMFNFDDGHYPMDEIEQQNNWQIRILMMHNEGMSKQEIIDNCVIEDIDSWKEQVEIFYNTKR